MDNHVIDQLRLVLKLLGQSNTSDVARFRAMMGDLLPGRRREINLLSSVISEGIAGSIKVREQGAVDDMQLQRWVMLLCDHTGVKDELAKSAILAWCDAFDVKVNQGVVAIQVSKVQLVLGDYVLFGKYNNAPILWRVIHKDSNSDPILFADRILTLKAFDAKGSYHSGNNDRFKYGSNFYKDSNIRQWLNSSSPNSGASTINWLQNAPIDANMWNSYNPYNLEMGFLADGNFTATERGLIKPYTHKVVLAGTDSAKKEGGSANLNYDSILSTVVQNYDTTAYYHIVTDNIFLLSVKQLKEWVYDNRGSLGKDYHIAKPTAEAVTQSTYKLSSLNSTANWFYWLNSPHADYSSRVRRVGAGGRVHDSGANDDSLGVRPALHLNLSSAIFKWGGLGTRDQPFTI